MFTSRYILYIANGYTLLYTALFPPCCIHIEYIKIRYFCKDRMLVHTPQFDQLLYK